jgi:hypothetical protein
MAYVPKWERLSDALQRVMTTAGLSKEDAKTDICQAISEEAIEIRVKLGKHTTKPLTSKKTVLEGKDLEIPTNIKAEDLDWEGSRPVKAWFVLRGSHRLHGHWKLEWIELSRTGVTNFLCATNQERGEPARQAPSAKRAKRRSRPKLEGAKRAIDELYPHPEGPPDPSHLSNASLCKRVGQKLKEWKLDDVSDETILRAAGRRRN